MIQGQNLDGLVVASCSPKLHLVTFRGVSKRAGLNAFEYTQVNIREQGSWAHSDDPSGTTEKAIGLVRAGIAKTRLSVPLEPITVETQPKTMVIGAAWQVCGAPSPWRTSDSACTSWREAELGGWVGRFGTMYPNGRSGRELIDQLVAEVRNRPSIVVLTKRS